MRDMDNTHKIHVSELAIVDILDLKLLEDYYILDDGFNYQEVFEHIINKDGSEFIRVSI